MFEIPQVNIVNISQHRHHSSFPERGCCGLWLSRAPGGPRRCGSLSSHHTRAPAPPVDGNGFILSYRNSYVSCFCFLDIRLLPPLRIRDDCFCFTFRVTRVSNLCTYGVSLSLRYDDGHVPGGPSAHLPPQRGSPVWLCRPPSSSAQSNQDF